MVESSPLYYLDMSDYDQSTPITDTDGDDSVQGPDNDVPVILLPGETDSDNNFVNGRPGVISKKIPISCGGYC